MDKLIGFSNKTEGRDKFCKVLQYGSRMLKTIFKNPQIVQKLNGIFVASRDARKVFRLWKSVHEYQTIVDTLKNTTLDLPAATLQIFARLSYFFYWIFDNLALLSSIKVINRDTKSLSKSAMTAWFIAIIFTLINLIRNYFLSYQKEAKLRKSGENPQIMRRGLSNIASARTVIVLNIIKNLGDFIPASNGANFPQKIFKFSFSERLIGLGGLISALISCYQAYPQLRWKFNTWKIGGRTGLERLEFGSELGKKSREEQEFIQRDFCDWILRPARWVEEAIKEGKEGFQGLEDAKRETFFI